MPEEPVKRWRLAPAGGIESDAALLLTEETHRDHLEMGGRAVNAIVLWEAAIGRPLSLERRVRWPSVRLAQDDTYGSFEFAFLSSADVLPTVDGREYRPSGVTRLWINGSFSWEETDGDITVRRTLFPSTGLPCLLERWEIRNDGPEPRRVRIPSEPVELLQPREMFLWAAHSVRTEWIGGGLRVLAPGETMIAGMAFSCHEENAPSIFPTLDAEWSARVSYRDTLYSALDLTTPDPILNQMFKFSKLRAAENVVTTRGGLMHGPGGFNRYLAALWCNDQNEYVSPFFPFLGDPAGSQSALNAYRWFARYQNDAFDFLPTSIVAEGRGTWQGAGDRGDAAMTAYGAARWALASGDETQARSLWPFIRWCLEYCEHQKDEHGVIRSDSDELEGRFSSGRTNLATSCLTYDALVSASFLAEALGETPDISAGYAGRAVELREAIERRFGATIEGCVTYRYHEDLDRLRGWICIPLAVGIQDRAAGTVAALFSPELWTSDGLLTEAGTSTHWDRSTLYALRGVFTAGYPEAALPRLITYASRRLLGDHVPYCVEASSEGNGSQLSAESGLFCRVVTEGICGIRPTGFGEFECTPQLPAAWPEISLRNICAFACKWDLQLIRHSSGIEVLIKLGDQREVYRAVKQHGETHTIKLDLA